ncbi:MAG: TetR family transcriptional regulator C-terminal domain-containing protein [Isosphaerales bacterium]
MVHPDRDADATRGVDHLRRLLAYLQLDLTDPDLHRHVRAQASATRAAVRELLEDAIAAGELAPTVDTEVLSRAVEVTLSGSLLTWAFYQDGPATRWVREDLDALLRLTRGASSSASELKPAAGTGRRVARPRAPRPRQ